MLGVANGRTDLHELLDGSLDLIVEDAAIGHHDDRVEHLLGLALHTDQLMGKPSDGVRFTATRGVLDQVALSCAVLLHIGQSLPHDGELMIARPHLAAAWVVAFVLAFGELGVSILVAPPGEATLPIRIYTIIANTPSSHVAALALLQTAVIFVPLAALGAAMSFREAR